MSPIPRISLTEVNRSSALLQAALTDHPLVFLTRYGKPALAVLPVEVLSQLLRIAEQAIGLVNQPNLLQVCAVLTTTQQTGLAADAGWLSACLNDLSHETRQIT